MVLQQLQQCLFCIRIVICIDIGHSQQLLICPISWLSCQLVIDYECCQQVHYIDFKYMGDLVDKALVAGSIALYLLGRICDDMTWYVWDGISGNQFEAIGITGLAVSALLITIVRLRGENGWKVLFIESQLRFIIPWALVVLQCTLVFNIFGCYTDDTPLEGQDMDHQGCAEYCSVLVITNYIYSTLCSDRGELPFFVVVMIVMFAEIIYSGELLVHFVTQLEEHPKSKDRSILFVSIMIAWLILVMDLNFRAIYEEPHMHHKVKKIHHKIHEHNKTCKHHKHEEANNSDMRLREQAKELIPEDPKPVPVLPRESVQAF